MFLFIYSQNTKEDNMNINIQRVPLCTKQHYIILFDYFWQICNIFVRFICKNVILWGIWQGRGKPPAETLFQYFVIEMNALNQGNN